MADESTATSGPETATEPPASPKPKAARKRSTRKRSSSSRTASKAPRLNEKQTAVLQLVTLAPAPRTADELANQYAGLREANLWPEQSVDQVKSALATLVKRKLLKEGDEAPDGEKTLELASAE